MSSVRPAAVAGTFYPGQKQVLANDVEAMLAAAKSARLETLSPPKAIIVPHAGYVYSGAVAATAYASLHAFSDIIKRVILLGPTHRIPVVGLALPGVEAFSTPLGEIKIDQSAVAAISDLPQVVNSAASHAQEHSLEVQLPFLQAVLDDFKLLPLAVGDASAQEVAEVLDILWGDESTLIVISSDLSHFHPYQAAQAIDSDTVNRILNLDGPVSHQQACGGTPVNGLLLTAKKHHMKTQLLAMQNSGDSSGDKSRVVGYASIAFFEGDRDA